MIDPVHSGANENVGAAPFTSTQGIDPGILMMAVSMMHMDAAHETARAKLGSADNAFATLTRLAPLAGKISQAKDAITQTELQATDGELGVINSFQARYVDNATINEADNHRFKQQQDWASERGIQLENSTKIIDEEIQKEVKVQVEVEVEYEVDVTTVDPDTGEETTTTETRTRIEIQERTEIQTEIIQREVADLDAISRNEAKLEAYKSQLNAGTADNPVLRSLIAADPEIQAASSLLEELGQSVSLESLSDLSNTIGELGRWTNELLQQIESHLTTAKTVHGQLTKLSHDWDDNLDAAAKLSAQQLEQDAAYSQMEKAALKLLGARQQDLPEFLAALGDAINETEILLGLARQEVASL